MAASYKNKFPKAEVKVGNVSWNDFKIEAKVESNARQEEPFRVRKYQGNHKIMNEDWVKKKREEIDNSVLDDKDLTLYKVENPAENLVFEKAEEQPPLDLQSFVVSKVLLEERSDYIQMAVRKTRHTSYVSTIKEKYTITFQDLNLEGFDPSCLSEHYVYILYTPITVYLWLGS